MTRPAQQYIRAAVALAGALALAPAVRDLRRALGATPTGDRADRARRSPQYREGRFHNRIPTLTIEPGTTLDSTRAWATGRRRRRPAGPVPVTAPPAAQKLASDGLHVTWYGHSTALVEIEGARILTDPVFSDRCSPAPLPGPRRLHPSPLPVTELPALDAVIISHDHYDHLDAPTVRALTRTQSAPFVVPLGVGAHLERWNVPAARIVEIDWDESVTVNGVRLTATEARHYSGRGLTSDKTLWTSWVLAGENRRVFYSGDSGYFPGYADIGSAYGPFDVTLMQIGAYGDAWADIHMTPEQALTAHHDVGGDLLIPLHWATFDLALHPWAEPADRLQHAARTTGTPLAVPRPGQRVDADAPPEVDGWWRHLA
ncbi:MBL fold metallo-hydrolase [[Kitasatospora] papulosa]|uniref:MBL fold metallo-hydrolase n=1 Tax=[Kitasatospora] papulosa TaxID=1464011 RepID=UPI00363ED46A